MDKIHATGTDLKLTAEQEKKLLAIVKSNKDILGLHYFANVDTSSDEDAPSGIALYFPVDAQVDSTLISDSMFQILAVSKVLGAPYGKKLDDEYFAKKLADIASSVEQYPKLAANGEVRDPSTNRDKKVWNSELGGPGSFAGVYFQLRDDHRTKDYFYVTQGTVPLVVQDLKQRIAEKSPNFQELIYGKEWKGLVDHASYLAQRNAAKNLATISEVCQTAIKRTDDVGASLTSDKGAPERAVPTWQQNTYSIRTTFYQGKPAVAIYNGVVPKADNSKERFFVVSNPYNGLYSFPLQSNYLAGASVSAIPADTGKSPIKTPENVEKVITWEGSASTSVISGNPLNKTIKEAVKAAGWNPEEHVGLLVPLALKVFNPELKRKSF